MLWGEMTEEEINEQCKKFEEDYFSKRSISIYELEYLLKFGWLAKDKTGGWGWYPDKPKYNKKKGTWKSEGLSLYLNCILKLDEDSVQPECSLIEIKEEKDGCQKEKGLEAPPRFELGRTYYKCVIMPFNYGAFGGCSW